MGGDFVLRDTAESSALGDGSVLRDSRTTVAVRGWRTPKASRTFAVPPIEGIGLDMSGLTLRADAPADVLGGDVPLKGDAHVWISHVYKVPAVVRVYGG